jgi:hypothetical protein
MIVRPELENSLGVGYVLPPLELRGKLFPALNIFVLIFSFIKSKPVSKHSS